MNESPQQRYTMVVTVGIDGGTPLDFERARLLIHDAADALMRTGGPVLMLWPEDVADSAETLPPEALRGE